MKAAVVTRSGGPEVIEFVDLPTPRPENGQVLIKILATMVNRLDHSIRQGEIAHAAPHPHILGMTAVGEVDIEDLKSWMPRIRSGHIRPLVDTVLPLSEAAQAHELVAAN